MTTAAEQHPTSPSVPAATPRAEQLARLLDPEQVVVFDGAMGTMLYNRGVFINQCYDELVLRSPDLVRAVHAEYVKAGAEVVETNTFGANRLKLAQYGLDTQVTQINRKAAELAREAAGGASPRGRGGGAAGCASRALWAYQP